MKFARPNTNHYFLLFFIRQFFVALRICQPSQKENWIRLCWPEFSHQQTFQQIITSAATFSRWFLPWRWRRYFRPKHRLTQDLRGVTSQKTAFFIVTAVKTSNLT
jgi:hypothetical protein